MRKLVLDFETASACDLKLAGAWRYSEDVTTEVISLSYGFVGEQEIHTWRPTDTQCSDANEAVLNEYALDKSIVFIAHNAGFEKAIWRNIMVPVFRFFKVANERWEDTAAVCAMKAIPASLDKATMALRLPVLKDTEGSRITKALSKTDKNGFYSRPEAVLQRVYEYNRQDVAATRELYERIGSLPEGEHKVWLLDQTINERGIRIDEEFVKDCQSIVDQASEPLIAEFKQITNGLKPTQTAKLKAWLEQNGVVLETTVNAKGKPTKSLNKEAIEKLLGIESEEDDDSDDTDLGPHTCEVALLQLPDMVRRALVIRSMVGSASVKKLKRMQACVGFDGRARGLLQYHGASPGRWAGRLLQPHNFPRGTIKDSNGKKHPADSLVRLIGLRDSEIIRDTIGEPIEVVVSSLRHALIAAKDHVFLSGDFATIEARVVLALAGQHDKTAIMAAGQDIYCDMAYAIYKRHVDKEKDPEKRQVGKNSVLGLGFQMGWKKFKLRYAKDETDEFCQNIVETYRDVWAPKVPKVWQALQFAALETVKTGKPHEAFGVEYRLEDSWMSARLPSGRKLWYFNPRLTKRAMPWDKTDIRLAWSYQQMKTGQLKTIDAFGGLLTENVVQGLARDLMVHAMFLLEQNGYPIVLTVHDEIVAEVLKRLADEKAFAQIMQERPQWAIDLQIPVAVETWCAERYRK